MSSINEDSDQENVESNNNKDTFDKESPNKRRFLCFNISNDSDEQKRLGQHPALPTLLRLSFGPLCSQIVSSMYLIVDSFWVSHTIGADGLTATGVVSLLETINNAFGLYLLSCVSARISYLFGQKKNEECAQVFIDIIRVSWIFSTILPIIMLNISRPLTKWFGADELIQHMSFQYLIPVSGLTVFYEMYQICCGLLQSEGLSWIYGLCQICSLFLNMACLDPLFLIVFKTPIWGASLASIISSFLPMIILMTLIFKGKFTVKPTFRMFFNKFSKETKSALILGLSTLAQLLSANLPDIMMQKWLGNAGRAIGQYNEVISAWNVIVRVYTFIVCVNNGIAQGLLPSTSFAFGAKRLKRFRNLVFHALWIGTIWNTLWEIIVITCSRKIAKIWLNDEKFLDLAQHFFLNGLCTVFFLMIKYATITSLQACKKVFISIILSILSMLIPVPLFSTILYYTDKDNPPRLFLAFAITDCISFVISFCVSLVSLRFLCKRNPDLDKDKVFGDENDQKYFNDKEPRYLDSDDSINENSDSKPIGSSVSSTSRIIDSAEEI